MAFLDNKKVGERLKHKRLSLSKEPSVRRFALDAGIDASQYAKIEKGDLPITENILDKIIDVYGMNKNFILYGTPVPHETIAQEPVTPYLKNRQRLKNSSDNEIPVFTGNTRAGTIEVYSDDPSVNSPVGHLPANIFPGCNHAEKVSGDSMHPIVINQGYVIGKIIDKKGIIFGEKYIIHTRYGMSMVKYLQEGSKKEKVKLVSYNKHIVPQEIPFDDIIFCCRIYFIVNPS